MHRDHLHGNLPIIHSFSDFADGALMKRVLIISTVASLLLFAAGLQFLTFIAPNWRNGACDYGPITNAEYRQFVASNPSLAEKAVADLFFIYARARRNLDLRAGRVDEEKERDLRRFTPPNSYHFVPSTPWMPRIKGDGDVPPLDYSISIDPDLRHKVEDFVKAIPFKSARDLAGPTEAILFSWAGVSNVAPGARGPYVDARRLGVVEAIMGQPCTNAGIRVDQLSPVAGKIINSYYQKLLEDIEARLIISGFDPHSYNDQPLETGRYHPRLFFQNFYYTFETDSLSGSIGDSIVLVVQNIALGMTPILEMLTVLRVEHYRGFFDLFEKAIYQSDHKAFIADMRAGFTTKIPTASQALIDSYVDMIELPSVLGTEKTDKLHGTKAREVIFGGRGDDTLDGGGGGDTYLYNLGDGHDVIDTTNRTGPKDRLVFTRRIHPTEVTTAWSEDGDITLNFIDGGSITLTHGKTPADPFNIGEVAFNDGTIWDRARLETRQDLLLRPSIAQ